VKDGLFVDKKLWASGGGKKSRFGLSKSKSPLDALLKKREQIDTFYSPEIPLSELKIEVFSKKSDSGFKEVELLPYLSSNPIECQNNFYRLERGKWFGVKTSRFESIIQILRQRKISKDFLRLPAYDVEDIKSLSGVEYKESIYNKKAVRSLSKNALLLDRKNICLDKNSKNIFEFGDILLVKDRMVYIIHVKRANAGQLSHLREQVERTGDYLATELNKRSTADFFFNIIFENFEKKAKSIKTKGRIFQSLEFASKQKEEEKKENDVFSEILLLSTSGRIRNQNFKPLVQKLQEVFPKEDYNLIVNHQEKFMRFFDRLLDFYNDFGKISKKKSLSF